MAYLDTLDCSHIVTVMHEDAELLDGFERYKITIKDDNTEYIFPFFRGVTAQIAKWLGDGRAVLIHCSSGVSRSAAVVLAFLVAHARLSLLDAFKRVQDVRCADFRPARQVAFSFFSICLIPSRSPSQSGKLRNSSSEVGFLCQLLAREHQVVCLVMSMHFEISERANES